MLTPLHPFTPPLLPHPSPLPPSSHPPPPGASRAATVDLLESAASAAPPLKFLNRYNAPRWLFRTVACLVLGGQVMARIAQGEGVWGGGGETGVGWRDGHGVGGLSGYADGHLFVTCTWHTQSMPL